MGDIDTTTPRQGQGPDQDQGTDWIGLGITVSLGVIACVSMVQGDTEVPKLIAVGMIGYFTRLYRG